MSQTLYPYVKALHLIAVIAWMAAILYLPRLFVYHAECKPGSIESDTFKIMERKLLRTIMNPAMILTWIFGLTLVFYFNVINFKQDIWFHVKLLLVVLMTVFHGLLAKWRKDFALDRNQHSARFYRSVNEVPAILMAAIVILVIVRPF